MDYDIVLAQVLDLLQQEQRLSYRVLKRRLQLDDERLEDLKEDRISLLLDFGVLGSNVVREVQCFFKTIEKEGLQGGKGD
jgi:hypothetical protein